MKKIKNILLVALVVAVVPVICFSIRSLFYKEERTSSYEYRDGAYYANGIRVTPDWSKTEDVTDEIVNATVDLLGQAAEQIEENLDDYVSEAWEIVEKVPSVSK